MRGWRDLRFRLFVIVMAVLWAIPLPASALPGFSWDMRDTDLSHPGLVRFELKLWVWNYSGSRARIECHPLATVKDGPGRERRGKPADIVRTLRFGRYGPVATRTVSVKYPRWWDQGSLTYGYSPRCRVMRI
jgi:hypothetical protein